MKMRVLGVAGMIALEATHISRAQTTLDCDIAEPAAIAIPAKPGDASDTVKHAYKLRDESIVFLGRLKVDADGAPRAYGPNNSGLDDLRNAGSPGRWVGVATDGPRCGPAGKPLVQSADDPAPGFYVSTTTMTNPAVKDCRKQRSYVDASSISYVALPPTVAIVEQSTDPAGRGNLVVVKALTDSNPSMAFQAERAPRFGFGEGSMTLVQKLGFDPNPRRGGSSLRNFVYLVLPDRMGFPTSEAQVEATTEAAFRKWGGKQRLKACQQLLLSVPR
jgi:hypothetical protein